jgi:two-component system response regulator NreC
MTKTYNDCQVLLIENDYLLGLGIAEMFNKNNVKVLDTALDGKSAIDKFDSLKPDLVLMEFSLPDINGVELTRKIKSLAPDTKVMMHSSLKTKHEIRYALYNGVDGFCVKGTDMELMKAGITLVLSDGTFIDPQINVKALGRNFVNLFFDREKAEREYDLTPREIEISKLMCFGKNYQEIAKDLGNSVNTIRAHMGHIFEKFEVNNRTDCIIKIWELFE